MKPEVKKIPKRPEEKKEEEEKEKESEKEAPIEHPQPGSLRTAELFQRRRPRAGERSLQVPREC